MPSSSAASAADWTPINNNADAAIAMKTKRRLFWDPVRERFKNDDEANAMLSRPQRSPYVIA